MKALLQYFTDLHPLAWAFYAIILIGWVIIIMQLVKDYRQEQEFKRLTKK